LACLYFYKLSFVSIAKIGLEFSSISLTRGKNHCGEIHQKCVDFDFFFQYTSSAFWQIFFNLKPFLNIQDVVEKHRAIVYFFYFFS